MQIASRADFGNGLHTASTQPYFYEGGYIYGELETSCALPVTVDGKCVTGELVFLKNKDGSPNHCTGSVTLPVDLSAKMRWTQSSLSNRTLKSL